MSDIKVYRTTVDDRKLAKEILQEIRTELPESAPSFDLEDCDRVLRVESSNGIKEKLIENILVNHGHQLEVLP